MGYELNGYADDTDKADERGFKNIINDKLKSAFVRLIRVVRVSIYSFLFRYEYFCFFFSPCHLRTISVSMTTDLVRSWYGLDTEMVRTWYIKIKSLHLH